MKNKLLESISSKIEVLPKDDQLLVSNVADRLLQMRYAYESKLVSANSIKVFNELEQFEEEIQD
jgi:hypothetical protein